MKHTYVILLWLCLFYLPLQAQQQVPNRIAKALLSKTNQRNKGAIPTFDLFQKSDQHLTARHAGLVNRATSLVYDQSMARRLMRFDHEVIELSIPFEDTTLNLSLYREDPVSFSFIAKSSDGRQNEVTGLHYRGILNHDYQSLASISIYDDQVMGVFSSTSTGNIILGKEEGEAHIIYRESDLQVDPDWSCEMLFTPDYEPDYSLHESHQRSAAECVQVYFETSYKLFQNKGSFTAVQNYVTGIFNNVATLYANEGINVEISEIFIWTSSDPYNHGSSSAALSSFISKRPSFNGTVAQLLDLTGTNNGGLAYVDVLCDNSFNVGYSDIHAGYNNFPTYSWTINVVAHELGHNFGSEHTHDCVWGPQNCTAIDRCGSPSPSVGCGSCAEAPIPPKGTIMSYCHVGGNGIDFNLGFGSEPGNRLRSKVAAASCLPQCGSGNSGGGCALSIDNVAIEDATCGAENGSIIVFISGESGTVTFDIGNGPQSNNVFNGVGAGTYNLIVTNGAGCDRSQSITISLASEQPNLDATVTNATCGQSDGVIELSAAGGQAPYSYRIGNKTQSSPLFSGLSVGNYTATLTDNQGCTASKPMSVFTDNPPELGVAFTHTTCGEANATVDLSAEGGAGGYTFQMGNQTSSSGQFNDVAAGDYVVQVTDGNGCIDDRSISIDASTPIDLEVAVTATACGQENGSLIIQATGGVGTLSYSIGGTYRISPEFDQLSSGNYELKVKDQIGCLITIEEEVAASESFALVPDVIHTSCAEDNGKISLMVDGSSGPYEYKIGTASFASDPVFADLSPGIYAVSAQDADGCVEELEIEVEKSTLPEPLPVVDRTRCGLANGKVEVAVAGGIAPYQFTLGDKTQAESTFDALAPGRYQLSILDAEGCVDSTFIQIDTSVAIRASLTTVPTRCGDANGEVSFVIDTGTAPYLYQVGENESTVASLRDLGPGTYPVLILDEDQCVWRDTVSIDPSPAIQLDADIVPTSCGLDNGQITFLATGGTGLLSYQLLDTTFGQQAEYHDLVANTYQMTVMDEANCTVTQTVEILPSTPPVLLPDITDTRCGVDNGAISFVTNGGATPYSYLLDGDTLPGSSIHSLAPGEYQLQVLDKFGCVDTKSSTIQASSAPILMAQSSPASCYQSNGSIVVEGSGGIAPYQYSVGGPFQGGTEFMALDSGNYLVILRDLDNCEDTISLEVSYDDQYVAPQLAANTSICDGDPARLDLGIEASTNITWTYNEQALSVSDPILLASEPGTYLATVTYHEECVLEAETFVSARPKPVQLLNPFDTICRGSLFSVEDYSDTLTYTWQHGVSGAEVAFSETGNYELVVTNQFDCSISKPLNLTVIQPIEFALDDPSPSACLELGYQWQVSGAEHYTWITEDPTIDQIDVANPRVQPTSDQEYLVIGRNRCFVDTLELSLHVNQDQVHHTEDTTLIEGSPLQLFVDEQAASAIWTTNYPVSCSECLESMTRPEEVGEIELQYTDINGCSWIDTILIDIIPLADVLPPLINVITPNEDGRNDVLAFEGMDTFAQYELRVFDQHGNLVYRDSDYENDWKGTLNGEPLAEGVYYYVVSLTLDDRRFQFDSDLTIIRD